MNGGKGKRNSLWGARSARSQAWAVRVAAFGLFAGIWEISTYRLESLLIPTFSQTMKGLFQITLVTRELWEPLMVSNQALVIGYLLSVMIGIPLGLSMARMRRIEQIADAYIKVMLAVPVSPLIPIIMMALGLGLTARVSVVILFALIFITVNTRAGVRNVEPELIEMAKSFGATEGQIWRRILIPGAMPAIMAGLRIGLGRAVTGMVIVELLLVASGIGHLLLEFRGLFEKDLLFALVFVVIIEAVILMGAMRAVERRLIPWTNTAATS